MSRVNQIQIQNILRSGRILKYRMLARALVPNCVGLQNVTKQLISWVFKGKRKFHSRGNDWDENDSFRFSKKSRSNDSFGFDIPKCDWDEIDLKPINKNFYNPSPEVLSRSKEEIEKFYADNDITVVGKSYPAPIFSFEEAGLPEVLLRTIRKLNYTEPTPIQSAGCPIALSGQNMVGIAQTGSGKTLGFVLPGVVHIQNQEKLERGDGPIVLILAPTRELVLQTHDVTGTLTRNLNMRSVAVYGGSSKSPQERQLWQGAEICIATPGRLLDFLNVGSTNLRRCTYLVLDEADRMLDMGFEPQMKQIFRQIRPDRQVLMWSATWPQEIQSLAHEYLREFVQLNVGSARLTANPNINQIVHVCKPSQKKDLLQKILTEIADEPENKTLIFAETKNRVNIISEWLNNQGFRNDCIHGDKNQKAREYVLKNFRTGRIPILVATDVAARGLDVTDVKYVINVDHPRNTEDYIHRIGRTGRHKAKGTSHTFFTDMDAQKASELINILKDANQNINPELKVLAGMSGSGNRKFDSGYNQKNHYNSRFDKYNSYGYGKRFR